MSGCLRFSLLENLFRLILQLTPATEKEILRVYSPLAFVRAVKKEGLLVYRAARKYAVPLTALLDRMDSRLSNPINANQITFVLLSLFEISAPR